MRIATAKCAPISDFHHTTDGFSLNVGRWCASHAATPLLAEVLSFPLMRIAMPACLFLGLRSQLLASQSASKRRIDVLDPEVDAILCRRHFKHLSRL